MDHPLLPLVDEALGKLTQAMIFLGQASKWADRDRSDMNPLAVLGGPLKYWKWHKAKKAVREADAIIQKLRVQCAQARDLPDLDVAIPKLDMISDIFDAFPFSLRRPRTVSPLKQMFTPETTALNEIETTRVTVDHAMSEVGLLHAKLRAKPAAS
jgi:hypothetical protein